MTWAERGVVWLLIPLLVSAPATTGASAEETPDTEFLEYLGSWNGEDSDWLAVAHAKAEELEPTHETDERRTEEAEADEKTD